MKAGLRQFCCNDAPNQPDGKTEMLGNDRPDEIALSNGLATAFPKLFILRVPFRDPRRAPLAHQSAPFSVMAEIPVIGAGQPLRCLRNAAPFYLSNCELVFNP